MASHFTMVEQAKNNLKKLETYITTGMDNTTEIALDLVEHDKDAAAGQLCELRDIMAEFVRMEKNLKEFVAAVDEVKRKGRENTELMDLEKLLDETLAENRSGEDDPTQHEKYVDMETRIEEIAKATQSTTAPPADKTPTQIDDDLAMTQQDVNTKCPYTMAEMTNPVKNRLCGHNYDRDGIESHLRQRKGKAKCPVPGCINQKPISPDDLEENRELRRFIENKNRQNRRGPKK